MSVSLDTTPTMSGSDWASAPDGADIAVPIGDLLTESGRRLEDVTVSFQRWGTPNAERSNLVLALHALTGNSHVTGPPDDRFIMGGWWDGLVGPGCVVDTDEWCVIAPNAIGGCFGSTGPGSLAPDGRPWGSRFPRLTVRDLVEAELRAFTSLGIERFAAVAGGSMGGARVLEWLISHPERIDAGLVLAVGARASADQLGTQTTQIAAITADPDWQGGDYYGSGRAPMTGMGIARRIAHLCYRSDGELDERFENRPQGDEQPLVDGRFAVQSYLEYQAEKLKLRFDPGSYVALTEVLNSHDVGRGRGGVVAALNSCEVPVVVGGIDSDRLYPLYQQAELAAELGDCRGGLRVVHSSAGHDGFLTERAAISELLADTMALARERRQ